ncbi:MAG: hypothetical protein MJZ00_06980 [Paludibacteraceae bacterium]|nr:hypothetical protein [Paludibacteraceae bacterium]
MDNNKGWFKTDRAIWQILKKSKKYSQAEAFIDLLSLANFSDVPNQTFVKNGAVVCAYKNQIALSAEKLAERWHINRGTVSKYLDSFERDGFITIDHNSLCNLITIVEQQNQQQNQQQNVFFSANFEQQKRLMPYSENGNFDENSQQQKRQQNENSQTEDHEIFEQPYKNNNNYKNEEETTTTTFSAVDARENEAKKVDVEVYSRWFFDNIESLYRQIALENEQALVKNALVEFQFVNKEFDDYENKKTLQRWHVEFFNYCKKRLPEMKRDDILEVNARRNWKGR